MFLAFASNRSKPDPDATYGVNIWVVAADNTDKGATATKVTTGSAGDHDPAWSPDGKWIAFSTQLDPKLFEYGTKHIAVAPANGGQANVLTLALDLTALLRALPPTASPFSFWLMTTDANGGAGECGGQRGHTADRRAHVRGMATRWRKTATLPPSTMDRPFELFTAPGGKLTRLTHVNDTWLSTFKLSPGEYVSFKSKDDTVIRGYMYKPLGYVAGMKYRDDCVAVPAYCVGLLRGISGPGAVVGRKWIRGASAQPAGLVWLRTGLLQSHLCGLGEQGLSGRHGDCGLCDRAGNCRPGEAGSRRALVRRDFHGLYHCADESVQGRDFGCGRGADHELCGHDQYLRDFVAELGRPWEHRAAWDRVSPFCHVEEIQTPTMFVGGKIDWNVPS